MPKVASIQSHMYVAVALSLSAATISVMLRFTARKLKRQRPFPDDWLILAALISEWAIAMAGLMLVRNGLGLHIDNVKPDEITTYLKVLYTGAPLYALTIILIKISILTLYVRIFPTRFIIFSSLIIGTTVLCWGFTSTAMGLFLCDPVSKAWRPEVPGQCLSLVRFYYGLQVPNIATDLTILFLPLHPLRNIRCSPRQKILLQGIFGLGILVVVFDIVRLVVLVQLQGKGADFTWNQIPAAIWTCVEPAAAMLTACLPHIKPVVQWVHQYWILENDTTPDAGHHENNMAGSAPHTPTDPPVTPKNCSPRRVAPSPGSIDFTEHITNNIADFKFGLVEFRSTPASVASASCSSKRVSQYGEAPHFPEVIDLFDVNGSDNESPACPPSTPTPRVLASPRARRPSIDTVIRIEQAVAET